MPLSTSNSEQSSWWWTWLWVVLVLTVTLTAYETFLIKRGFEPSVEANQDLWSWNRTLVNQDAQVVALVGASRMQLGINTQVMQQLLPDHRVVPLAINGQYPLATLKGLAEDSQFKGLVVMSFMAQMLEPRYLDMQSENNQYFSEKSSFYRSVDAVLFAHVQSYFRFLHPLLGIKDLVQSINKTHHFPAPPYISGQVDTSLLGDYSKTDTTALKQHFISDKQHNYQEFPIMGLEVWQQQLAVLKHYIERIEQRGGQVVLVRFPTDDQHWVLDELYYPKTKYWNQLQQLFSENHLLHFNDDNVLSSFSLPDSSHLDQLDATVFTVRLVEILSHRGFFD